MILRRATTSDSAAVADVFLSARKAFLPYAPISHPDADVRTWIRETLVPTGRVTVAETAQGIVGFVATADSDHCLWIDQLYVRPPFTSRSVGGTLLTHALTGACRSVRLYTFQANSGARRFYERFGFAPVAFTDGSSNDEKCPDVLYELPVGAVSRSLATARQADEGCTGHVAQRIARNEPGGVPLSPVEQAIARTRQALE